MMNQEIINDCEGTVKWWSNIRGYGFIEHVPGLPGIEVFCHYDDIAGDGYRNLEDGLRVRFDAVPNVKDGRRKGWKAVNVRELG
jgi:CspA family cold shock protein